MAHTFEARYPGKCACGCGAQIQGKSVTRHGSGYALLECAAKLAPPPAPAPAQEAPLPRQKTAKKRMPPAPPPTNAIESETCGRCGGTGSFGPLSVRGGICFNCGGAKKILTKRGRAASFFLHWLRSVPVTALKVGDLIQQDSITHGGEPYTYFARVHEVKPGVSRGKSLRPGETREEMDARPWEERPTIEVTTKHEKFGVVCSAHHAATAGEELVRMGQTAEQKRATLLVAIAYQATLNTRGAETKKTQEWLSTFPQEAK